jgi:hypothetical protein
MHGPTRIFWAKLTPFALPGDGSRLRRQRRRLARLRRAPAQVGSDVSATIHPPYSLLKIRHFFGRTAASEAEVPIFLADLV